MRHPWKEAFIGPAPEGRPQKKSKGVPPGAGPQALLKKTSGSDKKMVLWGIGLDFPSVSVCVNHAL